MRSGSVVGASILALSLLIVNFSVFLLLSPAIVATTSFLYEDIYVLVTSGLEFSSKPIWEEKLINTGETPINDTHAIVSFIGNGTITVPGTGRIVNMTNYGTAIVSPIVGSPGTINTHGKESVFSEVGDITAIIFYEILQIDPVLHGIGLAVFDSNATGTLAPFNGMIVVGTHEENPNTQEAVITLWEWQSGMTSH